MATASSSDIYQLKICLKRLKPPIWRRVQIPKDYTFKQLHAIIMNVMGWSGYHLHCFKVGQDKEIGVYFRDDAKNLREFGCEKLNEATVLISEIFRSPKDKIQYAYDLGYPWDFDIILEKVLPRDSKKEYPICVTGRKASPLEDDPGSDCEYDWKEHEFDPKKVNFGRHIMNLGDPF